MRRKLEVTLVVCDLRSCDNHWAIHKGGQLAPDRYWRGNSRFQPAVCEVLKAEFCSMECEQKAHTHDQHGRRWRRERPTRNGLKPTERALKPKPQISR